MVFIQDGKGRGFNAEVSDDNHLQVDSFALPLVAEISKIDGQTYSWASTYNVDGGSSIIYLQNTSPTKNLVIDEVDVGGLSGAIWELWTCTSDGAGAVISGTNHNLNSSNDAEARAFGNENITANSSGLLVGYAMHGDAGEESFHTRDSLILGQNDAIIVKTPPTAITTTSGICTIIGYFE